MDVKHIQAGDTSAALKADSVEARSFVAKDQHGKVCARLSSLPIVQYQNGTKITVLDPGQPGLALLEIYDENGAHMDWATFANFSSGDK